MTPSSILTTHGLGKRFGKRWAVRNLNIAVEKGDVYGFLGPNGAGKSTSIRMILSLIRPSEGDVTLMGHSLKKNRSEALRRIGGIVERPDFYLYLSAFRNLEIVGSLYGAIPKKRISQVLELVGLENRAYDKVKTFSHGMKQRLGIAQTLLSDPEFIILDEPTNGLDPQGMKEIRDLIIHLSQNENKTILLSSHLLHEIELVATRMAIIHRGALVVQGKVQELLDGGANYVLLKAEPREAVRTVFSGMTTALKGVKENEQGFRLELPFSLIPDLVKMLAAHDIKVFSIEQKRSLEEYFLSITEEQTGAAHIQV